MDRAFTKLVLVGHGWRPRTCWEELWVHCPMSPRFLCVTPVSTFQPRFSQWPPLFFSWCSLNRTSHGHLGCGTGRHGLRLAPATDDLVQCAVSHKVHHWSVFSLRAVGVTGLPQGGAVSARLAVDLRHSVHRHAKERAPRNTHAQHSDSLHHTALCPPHVPLCACAPVRVRVCACSFWAQCVSLVS